MNKIVIRYSYFSNTPEVLINNETVSPYSELSSLLNSTFWEYAANLFKALDNEIYDDYTIELYGNRIQFDVLKNISNASEYCKDFSFYNIDTSAPPSEIETALEEICQSYGILQDKSVPAELYISPEANINDSISGFTLKNTPEAIVGIFGENDVIPNTVRLPIVLSDKFGTKKDGSRTTYIIPKNSLPDLEVQLKYEYVFLPKILSLLTALKYTNISDEHKAKLDYYRHGKPSFIFKEYPISMDKGETVEVKFISFPADHYTLRSDIPSVIYIDGSRLTALNSGNANIIVLDKEGAEHKRISINVIEHHYVESIRLIPRFDYLKRNDRNVIDIVLMPQNAEDSSDIIWEVSDPRIISVDQNGNVIALNEGIVRVNVRGKKASASINIEVKPSLQRIYFPSHSICLKGGETYILECRTEPQNAPIDALQWELDNRNIASINPSKTGLRCQVIASSSYEGKGNIKCYDSNTRLGAICNLEVVSKIKSNALGKAALTCLLLGIIMPLLLPISTITSVVGLAKDDEADHKKRYVLCLIFSIIISVFWISVLGNQ